MPGGVALTYSIATTRANAILASDGIDFNNCLPAFLPLSGVK